MVWPFHHVKKRRRKVFIGVSHNAGCGSVGGNSSDVWSCQGECPTENLALDRFDGIASSRGGGRVHFKSAGNIRDLPHCTASRPRFSQPHTTFRVPSHPAY